MPLQAQQIVAMAAQIARVPGFTSQAGQLLNAVLSELCQDYDFELARGVYNFNFNSAVGTGSGPYTLPADFLRSKNKDVFYTITGQPYPMIKLDLQEYDWLVQQAGLQSYPAYFTTDMSQTPPVMFVWAPPSGAYPVTQRYYRQMPDIATPETSTTIPWFPNQNYLITRLAGELMKIADDDRCGQYLGDSDGSNGQIEGAQSLLRKYLKMKDDKGDMVNTVQLDRRVFGRDFSRLSNTKSIGW